MAVMPGPALVVVWADPGMATGWSIHRVPISSLLLRGQVGAMGATWWRVGQFTCATTSASVDAYLELCRKVWAKAEEEDVVVIGSESFTLRMQSTDPALLEPVRFNAVLEDRLRGTGVRVEYQTPSAAKNQITDVRLRSWGVWVPGPDHPRDAQKHGLLFLRSFASQVAVRRRCGWLG